MALSQIFQRTEGIILRVYPFRDYDQILVLFTRDAGVIKIIYKGSRSKRRGVLGLCIPLTRVEVVFRENKSEICSCHEMSLIDSMTLLRQELTHLEVACDLLQAVFSSQMGGKPAPQLYYLLCMFLDKIPHAQDPWILSASFRLKLMKYEGLSAFPLTCSMCNKCLVESGYVAGGEWLCRDHGNIGSTCWDAKELQLINRLADCQNYREISCDIITPLLRKKLLYLFEDCIRK